MMKRIPNWVWWWTAYFLVALFIYRLLLGQDTPGFIYDWGYNLVSHKTVANDLFYIWNSSNGGIIDTYKTNFYFDLLNLGAALLHISNVIFFKVALVVLSTLAGGTMAAYLQERGIKKRAAYLAGFFYQTSPFLLIRLTAGYFGYSVSSAFFPLLLLFILRSSKSEKIFNRFLLGSLLASLFSFSQIHFLVFYALLAFWEVLYTYLAKGRALKLLAAYCLTLAGYLLANLFWLIPSLIKAGGIVQSGSLTSMAFASRVDGLPHKLWNTLLLSDHGITEDLILAVNAQPSRLWLLFFFLLLIAVLAYQRKKGRRDFLIFTSLALCILPISVADTLPFTNVYPRLFAHIPGITAFRETYHLEYVLLIVYTVWLAMGLDYLASLKPKIRLLSVIICFLLPLYLIIVFNLPTFSGDLFGYFGGVKVPANAAKANQEIKSLSSERVFYPPGLNFWKLSNDPRTGVNYPDQLALSFDNDFVTEASSDLDSKSLTWKLRNAMVSDFMNKDQQFLHLLPYLGSNIVVDRTALQSHYSDSVQLNARSQALQKTWISETNASKLAHFPELQKQSSPAGFSIYTLPNAQAKIYLATNPASVCNFQEVAGSYDSFFYTVDPSVAPFVTSTCSNPEDLAIKNAEVKFDFGKVANLKHSPDLGWSPGFLSFYESPTFANTIEDFIYTRIPDQFVADLPRLKPGQQLLLKYYVSPLGGTLTINGQKINSKAEEEGWRYQILPFASHLVIVSSEGENAVGALALVDDINKPATLPQAKLANSPISFNEVNPTLYSGDISQKTSQPKLLIFSENYNPNWKLTIDGQTINPIIVNTYANGYLVPGNLQGKVQLQFASQPLYQFLLDISLFFVGMSIFVTIVFASSHKSKTTYG